MCSETKRVPKEAIYYVLKELKRYLSHLKGQLEEREDEALTAEVSEVEEVISQLERAISDEDYGLFAKAFLKLRTMDVAMIADDPRVRESELYQRWQRIVDEAKRGILPVIDLKEFLEVEWQRLFLGVGIVQELSQLEQDPEERELIVGTFRDAFRHYYFALDALTRYLKERDQHLLDVAMDEMFYATWFMFNLLELIPEEYERELESLLETEAERGREPEGDEGEDENADETAEGMS